MFVDLDRPAPSPPIAEGAYRVLMPVAVLLATPVVIGVLAAVLDQ